LAKISKKYGLESVDSKAPGILTPAEFKHFREAPDKLTFIAQEEIDELCKVVREAGYAILLWDSTGRRSRAQGRAQEMLISSVSGNCVRHGFIRPRSSSARHFHLLDKTHREFRNV
jgi:hypothetical protein